MHKPTVIVGVWTPPLLAVNNVQCNVQLQPVAQRKYPSQFCTHNLEQCYNIINSTNYLNFSCHSSVILLPSPLSSFRV